MLVTPNEVPEFKNYIHEILIANKQWATSHKDLATRVATAVGMGNNFLLNHSTEAVGLLEKGDFKSVDPAIVQSSFNSDIKPAIPPDGKMSEALWKDTNTLLIEAGFIKQPLNVAEGTLWTNAYIGNTQVP